MKYFIALFFASCLFTISALGQQTEIDKYCQRIDSAIATAQNIGQFLVHHPSDSDTTRLYDRYFIDTVNFVLLKSIYDCNYYAIEYIEFYYKDTLLVKINARHQLDDKNYAGVFYYQQGKIITSSDELATAKSNAFDIGELERTGKQYMRDSKGIFDLIKKKGNSEPNRRR